MRLAEAEAKAKAEGTQQYDRLQKALAKGVGIAGYVIAALFTFLVLVDLRGDYDTWQEAMAKEGRIHDGSTGKAVPFKKLPHLVAERNWTEKAQVLLPRGYCLWASTPHPTRDDVRPQYSGDNGETWTSQWLESFGTHDVLVRFRSQLERRVRVEYDLYPNPNPGRPCRTGGPRIS